MKFNDIIRQALKEAGITQQQFADQLGIRQTAVSNIINRDNITLAKFITIMDLLGYEVLVRKGDTITRVGDSDNDQ